MPEIGSHFDTKAIVWGDLVVGKLKSVERIKGETSDTLAPEKQIHETLLPCATLHDEPGGHL